MGANHQVRENGNVKDMTTWGPCHYFKRKLIKDEGSQKRAEKNALSNHS
jgi:hypothetical protein